MVRCAYCSYYEWYDIYGVLVECKVIYPVPVLIEDRAESPDCVPRYIATLQPSCDGAKGLLSQLRVDSRCSRGVCRAVYTKALFVASGATVDKKNTNPICVNILRYHPGFVAAYTYEYSVCRTEGRDNGREGGRERVMEREREREGEGRARYSRTGEG